MTLTLILPAAANCSTSSLNPGNLKYFFASQFQRLGALSREELQRQDAHADQVGAMNALVALRNHGLHAQQPRALGRPVARGTRAVFLAGENHQRDALGLYFAEAS